MGVDEDSHTLDVSAFFRAGRAAWPQLPLREEHFAGYLTAASREGLPRMEYAKDLFLACACANRVPGAAAALEPFLHAEPRVAVARVDGSGAFVDDVLQTLREKLLVGTAGSRLKIADYAGRAPLVKWLAVVATRSALNARRGMSARMTRLNGEPPPSCALTAVAVDSDYIKTRYKSEVEAAVRAAFSRLDDRARALLKLHFEERMTIDRLGGLYKVSKSTAARWLTAARDALLEETRLELATHLGLTTGEFDSLVAVVRSGLEIDVFSDFDSSILPRV